MIDNKQFVQDHPALQEFLQQHPGIREEFEQNPNAFMRQEDRYDQHQGRGDNDITRKELASFDQFLDGHPEIAEQLRKDPWLINDKQFVENHPGLQRYLQDHPEVSEAIKRNPRAFMRDEDRYDHNENAQNHRDHGEMSGFGDFLRGHSTMAGQLSKDPSLANNREYLESHAELRDYLKEHPEVQQQLAQNPQAVMNSPELVGTPKSPTPGFKAEPKQ